jgi:hypothetical protein
MKFPVRLLFAVFLFLISFFVFRSVSFAQTTTSTSQSQQTQPYLSANTNPDVPRNLHTWTQTVLIEVIAASSCAITGMDPTNPNQQCLGVDQKTGKIGFVKNGRGAIGMLTSSLAILYNPAVHTGDYIGYLSNNFGLTKSTYAADNPGTGFQQLSPLMNIWVAFRNISYLFFIIIFLVIGVAIMLRVRIDPRTVMTIQNQIPKIIIGVVMVTFSFAIAGALIDLMWTSMYVSYGILSTVPGANLTGLDPQSMRANTPLGVANSISYTTNDSGSGTAGIANQISIDLKKTVQSTLGVKGCNDVIGCFANFNPITSIVTDFTQANVVSIFFDIISGVIGAGTFYKVATMLGTQTAGGFLGLGALFAITGANAAGLVAGGLMYSATEFILREALPWLIIFLVVYVAMFVALIRLWFELIKAYIFILFDVVLAPFWIMAGLLPGNTTVNFSSWIRDLAANLAAFPAVAIMFMLGKIIMTGFTTSPNDFVPPLVGNPGDTNFLAAIIGLAIILSTPQVVIMVKKALKAPGINLGGVASAISGGTSVITGGAKSAAVTYMKTPTMGQRGGLGAFVRRVGGM